MKTIHYGDDYCKIKIGKHTHELPKLVGRAVDKKNKQIEKLKELLKPRDITYLIAYTWLEHEDVTLRGFGNVLISEETYKKISRKELHKWVENFGPEGKLQNKNIIIISISKMI